MPNTHWFDWMCFILGLTQPRILTPNRKQLNTPGHMGNRNTEGTQKPNPGKHLSWRSSWINIESTATALVPLPEHTNKAPTIRLRQPLTISDVEEMWWRGWWESVIVAGIFGHNSRDLRDFFSSCAEIGAPYGGHERQEQKETHPSKIAKSSPPP